VLAVSLGTGLAAGAPGVARFRKGQVEVRPVLLMDAKKPVGAEELSPSVSVSMSSPMRSNGVGLTGRLYTRIVARPPSSCGAE